MRPLGRTTGASSTILLVCRAYGTLRASSLSSALQMGQTVVAEDEAFVDEGMYSEWQAGVLRAERPALRAMCRRGRGGSEYRL